MAGGGPPPTNGLHSEHLTLWEQELGNLMTDKQDNLKFEVCDPKKQVKDLEKYFLDWIAQAVVAGAREESA